MKDIYRILFVIFITNSVFAQRDSVLVLDEVVLTDSKLQHFSNGIKLSTLKDSVLDQNLGSLSDNLRSNSHIYFKENGYGMVSSVAFRGTSAQQTAVVWNGININSQLTGQTDFNTVMAQNLDRVQIRSGGGSTQYGTGAVGGSVHLNNQLRFNSPIRNKLILGYGSFDSRKLFYKTNYGSEKLAVHLAYGYNASENNYEYLGTTQRNENGEFATNAFDLGFGLSLSKTDLLKVFHHTFLGDRNFSGTLTAVSNDRYKDLNSRSLIEWVRFKNNKVHRLRAAYLFERFEYYPNLEQEDFSYGKAANLQLDYDYKYQINNWIFNGILTSNLVNAKGSSIQSEARQQVAAVLLISRKASDKLGYGFNFRKDWVSGYSIPFVFSVDGKYQLSNNYGIRLNASTNYRVPTFNDLYWQGPGAMGNRTVSPENSYQFEIGQIFKKKRYEFGLTGFYIASSDLIQWQPDLNGIWSPTNIQDATQYGVEAELQIAKSIGNHNLVWFSSYAFTKAIDKASKNQLIYVPKHKFTSNISYSYQRWNTYVQSLFNGKVFTTTDNNSALDEYLVMNLGVEYNFPRVFGVNLRTGIALNNLANVAYENVAFRPMPNRNVLLNFNFKF